MQLLGKLAVGLLDVVLASVLLDAEDAVGVFVQAGLPEPICGFRDRPAVYRADAHKLILLRLGARRKAAKRAAHSGDPGARPNPLAQSAQPQPSGS